MKHCFTSKENFVKKAENIVGKVGNMLLISILSVFCFKPRNCIVRVCTCKEVKKQTKGPIQMINCLFSHVIIHSLQNPSPYIIFTSLYENSVGKEEDTGHHHLFHFFSFMVFLYFQERIHLFYHQSCRLHVFRIKICRLERVAHVQAVIMTFK